MHVKQDPHIQKQLSKTKTSRIKAAFSQDLLQQYGGIGGGEAEKENKE